MLSMVLHYTFFYFFENKLYKKKEAEIGKSIKTNEEHFEAEKFKKKKLK